MSLEILRILLYTLFAVLGVLWFVQRRQELLPGNNAPKIDWMTTVAELLLLAFPVFAYTVKHRQWMLLSIGMLALLAGEHVVRSIKTYRAAQVAADTGQLQIEPQRRQRWVGYAAGYGLALVATAAIMYAVYSTTPIDACIVCVKDIGTK